MKFLLPVLGMFLLAGCASAEASLKQELSEANHCETEADCILIGSKCPFDCFIYVHASEAERLKAKVDAFQSTCMYACVQSRGVECRDNVCRALTELPTEY